MASFSELIPHAPHVGLYVAPNIPDDKLDNALADYAKSVPKDEVQALYDATRMGSAKDGAVFTRDRMVFQNHDLQPVHEIRYDDVVEVGARRRLLLGRRLTITVNRGRATFEIEMDFSAKPGAADYVLRFLREAMLRSEPAASNEDATDVDAVTSALENLHAEGLLSRADLDVMLRVLSRT